MNTLSFDQLDLIEPLRRALRALDYQIPTPIQSQTIPVLLAGQDLMASAQTGSGKTAAFALPMLQMLNSEHRRPEPRTVRSLVLAPTRELASQIAAAFSDYGRFLSMKKAVVYGGVGKKPQIDAIAPGIDVLIATPGRLLDLHEEKRVRLDRVEIFVLDEADRMLDMGFIPDVRRIIGLLPKQRQSLFFSATLPPEVLRLAQTMLSSPQHVAVAPETGKTPRIEQRVLFVDREAKTPLLLSLLEDPAIERALVFTRTKHRASRLAEQLIKNRIRADAIHGNKTQQARERALAEFHTGKIRVLVATDIAARGIDVDDVSHVINFELPNEPESYVHRIGRTARAGKAGVAISFCDESESGYLRDIERLLDSSVPVASNHPFHSNQAAASGPAVFARTGGRRTATGGMLYGGGRGRGRSMRGRR
jgi:ATP-dependent RNA helicase RhlE